MDIIVYSERLLCHESIRKLGLDHLPVYHSSLSLLDLFLLFWDLRFPEEGKIMKKKKKEKDIKFMKTLKYTSDL